MRAAVFHRYGGTDVLAVEDVPRPTPGAGEVLVRVEAAAVNPKDTFIRKGRFRRYTGTRFPLGTAFDFAGVVETGGHRSGDPMEGEPVYGMLDGWKGGAAAEYVVVRPRQVARRPAGISAAEAASLPLVALTALQALRDEAGLSPGQRLCINGASGGVGSMAVQVARLLEARVTAVASASHHERLLSLGAERCVDYHHVDAVADAVRADRPFDVFFDVFGNRPFKEVRPALTARGVWVSTVLKGHVFRSVIWSRLIGGQQARLVVVRSERDDLDTLRAWVEDEKLRPQVAAVLPLERIAEAHALQESRHAGGKIVLTL